MQLMPDIYNILSKHFAKEASKEENQLVEKFKLDQPEEYKSLKNLWSKSDFPIEEYDKEAAWVKLTNKTAKPNKNKVYQLYRNISIAAILLVLVSFFAVKHFGPEGSAFVEPVQIIAIGGPERVKKLELEDGSIIYLSKTAKLSYPERFDRNSRTVSLEGEAFFEIARDETKPFRVKTEHSDVEVLGTSFNVNSMAIQTQVSVATGKVQVNSNSSDEMAILLPNESVVVNNKNFELSKSKNQNYLSWKTGVFQFEDATIKEVVQELNEFYGNKISLKKENSDCLLSASFNNLELKQALEIVELSCRLKLKTNKNNYELH